MRETCAVTAEEGLDSAATIRAQVTVPGYEVLGTRIDAVQIQEAVEIMQRWVERRVGCRFVVLSNTYGVTRAQHSPEFRRVLRSADLCVADGWPLMIMGRIAGYPMRRRVYGPELMLSFIERTLPREYRHFFYGGSPGVADDLAGRLVERFAGLKIAGTFSPPYGPLSKVEDPDILRMIHQSRTDVLWVGLGAPKQETWMYTRRGSLQVPVLVGVGAAFDFLTCRVSQAPEWMREHGLEWLFRLAVEPARLWRRYLIDGGEFVVRALTNIFTGGMRRMTK